MAKRQPQEIAESDAASDSPAPTQPLIGGSFLRHPDGELEQIEQTVQLGHPDHPGRAAVAEQE